LNLKFLIKDIPLHCAIRPATPEELPIIAALADTIWRAHYPGIITAEQIDYMLAQRYNAAALATQMAEAGNYFDLMLVDDQPSAFAHYFRHSDNTIKLDKLYLLPALHGKGYGSRLLHHVKARVRELGGDTLVLAVNKHNKKAVDAYVRSGFEIRESAVVDIGNGFVMDDYVMALSL